MDSREIDSAMGKIRFLGVVGMLGLVGCGQAPECGSELATKAVVGLIQQDPPGRLGSLVNHGTSAYKAFEAKLDACTKGSEEPSVRAPCIKRLEAEGAISVSKLIDEADQEVRRMGVYSLKNIRVAEHNRDTGKSTCQAELWLTVNDAQRFMEIVFTLERTTDGKLYTTVSHSD